MLELLKEKVLRAAVKAEESGLCMHRSGNFSMIDRESGLLVISPSGRDRKDLRVADFPVLDLSGKVVEEGIGKPSIEYGLHIKAYETRPEIRSVVHTHSHFASAFAAKGIPIEPVVFEAVFYGVTTALAECFAPGTQELADCVADPLKTSDAVLMRHHGVLCVGDEIDGTLLKAQYVEDVARVYYYALNIPVGEPVRAIPAALLDQET